MLLREAIAGTPRLRGAGALALAILASAPVADAAAPRHDRAVAGISAAAGVVYGGVTPQNFGVVIEVNRSRRQVVRAATGLHLDCTSGGIANFPDRWTKLNVSKSGKFKSSFGPEPSRNDDGTMVDAEGSISGRFNSRRTSVSGTWMLKLTYRDAAGTVTDTCDSGTVKWTAKQ